MAFAHSVLFYFVSTGENNQFNIIKGNIFLKYNQKSVTSVHRVGFRGRVPAYCVQTTFFMTELITKGKSNTT